MYDNGETVCEGCIGESQEDLPLVYDAGFDASGQAMFEARARQVEEPR